VWKSGVVTAIRDDCVGGGLNEGCGGSDGSHCYCGGGMGKRTNAESERERSSEACLVCRWKMRVVRRWNLFGGS